MKTKSVILLAVIVLLTSGCTTNDNVRKPISNNNIKKEVPGWKPDETPVEPKNKTDIKQTCRLGETIKFEKEDGRKFDVTVKNAYLTSKLEEDVSEWDSMVLEGKGITFTDGKIDDEHRIVYIETQVVNHAEETLMFDMSHVKVVFEKSGELLYAVSDLGYGDKRGEGKSANMLFIEQECSEVMKTGFILDKESKGYPLYLELSGNSSVMEFILLPLDDTVKE